MTILRVSNSNEFGNNCQLATVVNVENDDNKEYSIILIFDFSSYSSCKSKEIRQPDKVRVLGNMGLSEVSRLNKHIQK